MSRKDNLVKSKSIYTLRAKHMTVPNGTIFENDHVTIIKDDGIFSEGVPLFSDSNFKFRIGEADKGRKKHSRGGFTQVDSESGNVWTLANLPDVKKSTDGEIELKGNYTSIKDFAYFGSAVELIKATINDVVMRYPGGLYYYPNNIVPSIKIGSTTYYMVSNEFNIDFWSPKGCNIDGAENPLRILGANYMNYYYGNTNDELSVFEPEITGNCPESIIGTVRIGTSSQSLQFSIYLDGEGNKYLLTTSNGSGTIIRPKDEFFDEFWGSVDDFEKVLLNRKSKPLYRAVLERPYISEGKHYYEYKTFTWPTIVEGVPDVSSGVFGGYLQSLMEIAEYYDEYDSDNIWRMMTHESIKNLDYTFNRTFNGEDVDMSDIDFSRMRAMLRIHGRLFDDIKRYADGIKYINSITYDGQNNLPDYFLSDTVELGGYEAKSINKLQKTNHNQEIFSEDCFSGVSEMSIYETNGEFMKRLALSKDYIMSEKGTRRGIQSILGMFGYRYAEDGNLYNVGDYTIKEHIRVAHRFPKYKEMSKLRSYSGEYLYYDNNDNFMDGFPVAVVAPAKDNPTDMDYYLIPWLGLKSGYLNDIYFQEKGGWGRIHDKEINLSITQATEIHDRYGKFCLDLYSETIPYMMYVNDIDELTSLSNNVIYEGMICYVTDITQVYTKYYTEEDFNNAIQPSQQEEQTQSDRGLVNNTININQSSTQRDYSHYFILYNTSLSTHIGFVNNEFYSCYGWRNILNSEFNGPNPTTLDGLKVLYLESLNLDAKGNNPHCGYGKYDNGDSYIEKYNRLFGSQIDDGLYDYMKDDIKYQQYYNDICAAGFDIRDLIVDNKKCYYFYDNVSNGNETEIVFKAAQEGDHMDGDYSEFFNAEDPKGRKDVETAAFSIMNVKNLIIEIKTDGNKHFEKYLSDVVFKYLNELIPSTAILWYEFVDGNTQITPSAYDGSRGGESEITREIVADGVIVDDNSTYYIENND